eukprot:TRINITY_DN324_c3_g2_i2.p1 TRINITY_DN324_c3_g2~~TRINITY_DN324_c3_g2_i2.p1  ORF type:complete len:229 (+),score=39.87 TRINITY_DN324_c3_g2_i2:62-748(+)
MSDSDSDDAVDHLQYKVLVVGDGAVGKTSLIMRFCEGGFKESYRQTVGLDFFNKRLALPGQVNTTLQIWDIGGQQLGGKMLGNYLFGSHAILMTYDVTSMESFKNLEQWLEFVKTTFKDKKTMPYLALVGNKMDLNHLRSVKAEKHSLFAVENGMVPFFVSAKTGDKVNAAFTKIAADLSGVQLTKSELDVTDTVVHAPIVNHPKATSSEDVPATPEGGKDKKDCTVM